MPADKGGGPSSWIPLVLGGSLLLLLAAGVALSSSGSSQLAAWRQGLDPAALFPRLAAQQEPPQQQPQPQPQQEQPQQEQIDLAAAAPVFGLLPKQGPNPGLAGLAAGMSVEELSFSASWMAARLRGEAPPLATKWCAIMFNDRYRLIFLKCPKTAGNTLVSYFGLCQKERRDTCLEFLNVYNASQVAHLHAAWPHYFVFGFTRNILARAVSQYKYLTHFMAGCPAVSWGAFCRDPFVLGDACLRNAQAGNLCCTQSADHQYVHVVPQAHCFTTADGGPAVDFLGRVEHFEDDFQALVALLNVRPGVQQLPPPGNLTAVNYAGTPCQPRRRLGAAPRLDMGSKVWQLAEGTFNPCDPLDYFRGPHAHCRADLLAFFAEDVRFLHPQAP